MLVKFDSNLIDLICCGSVECLQIYIDVLKDIGRSIYIEASEKLATYINNNRMYRLNKSLNCINIYYNKGFSSYIYKVVINNRSMILKIRRVDSKKDTLYIEGVILDMLKKWEHSPKVYRYTHNYILMEHINGITFKDAIYGAIRNSNIEILLKYLKSLIKALYELDKLKIDHKEIGAPYKHVIYRDNDPEKPILIDFESASITVNPNNLPRFVGGTIIRKLSSFLNIDKELLIEYMKQYKKGNSTTRNAIYSKITKYILDSAYQSQTARSN